MFKAIWRRINNYFDPDKSEQLLSESVDAFYRMAVNSTRGISTNFARDVIIKSSIVQDKTNSQYSGILNTLSNHCLGTVPLIVGLSDDPRVDDSLEDRWIEWSIYNGIGSSLREARRKAAQTGICVVIPYKSKSVYELKLAFRVVGAEALQSPSSAINNPAFENPFTGERTEGIEFWPNGEIKRVWINEDDQVDPTPYSIPSEAFVWYKGSRPFKMWPECSPAFTVIPSMTRFIDNVMAESEFKTAIPMAVKLDGEYYKPNTSAGTPKGVFKYEPGMIPTLPPGADLVGIAMASMAEDRGKLSDKFCQISARCVDMPRNLALASSSDSNMATAHIDLQPWKYVVDIDRHDFEIIPRLVYRLWYSMVTLTTLVPSKLFETEPPPVAFNYSVLLNHPDPMKCATARATDLESGASTLTIQYSEQSRNARREIEKECKLLGITKERYFELLLSQRGNYAAQNNLTKNKGFTKQERAPTN